MSQIALHSLKLDTNFTRILLEREIAKVSQLFFEDEKIIVGLFEEYLDITPKTLSSSDFSNKYDDDEEEDDDDDDDVEDADESPYDNT